MTSSLSAPPASHAYITAAGSYLPGPRIGNDDMEDYLGLIAGQPSRLRRRMLKQNGITGRHYAIDKTQKTTHQNVDLAVNAVRAALARGSLAATDVDQLVAATSQGDLPLPGFGSMVHGELAGASCEVVTHHGVCASGLAAIKTAAQSVRAGEHANAVAVASELPSRLFKASRYEDQLEVRERGRLDTDAEFLRWMLSDGAGAVLVQDQPAARGLSLKVDWIRVKSHAHRYPTCMYVGGSSGEQVESWLDAPDYADAAERGLINLRQDLRVVDRIVKLGVADYLELIEAGLIDPASVDHMLCHFSSRCFLQDIKARAEQAGAMIPAERWSTVMYERGNVGSASLYLMLDDLFARGALELGQRVLCMVPESGRFTTGFMHLTVVDAATESRGEDATPQPPAVDIVPIDVGQRQRDQRQLRESLQRQLMLTWHDFEQRLEDVPFIDALYHGRATLPEYRLLLRDLRQQVVQGASWIARAVSSIDAEHVELRNAFLEHAGDEHLDYQILERDYVNCQGRLEDIQGGTQNPGSEALSAFMMHRASQNNPWDMLGAMFIIEGLGHNMANHWATLLKAVLGLSDDQVRFLSYHGANDEAHTDKMYAAFEALELDEALVARIVRTARMTARLYCLQLTEMAVCDEPV